MNGPKASYLQWQEYSRYLVKLTRHGASLELSDRRKHSISATFVYVFGAFPDVLQTSLHFLQDLGVPKHCLLMLKHRPFVRPEYCPNGSNSTVQYALKTSGLQS